MKQMSFVAVLLSVVLLTTSCQNKGGETSLWGETRYYKDWLWDKYEPIIMEQTLQFDFNDDAKRLLQGETFTFVVVEFDEEGNEVSDQFVLYKNKEKCDDASFSITTADSEVVIGVEFLPTAREGNHKLYLREKGASGLTRVDYTELTEGVYVKKNDIMNPLAKGSAWSGGTLVVIFIAWLIVSRLLFWPAMSFSKVKIDYQDGMGPRQIRVMGAYELVLTNDRRKKDNIFEKIFKGSRVYEVNEFWTSPLTLKSGMRKSIQLRPRTRYNFNPLKPTRQEEFMITNSAGKSVKIQTN